MKTHFNNTKGKQNAVEQTLVGYTGYVWSVAFNHDGTKIVSGSGDQKVCIWDAATGAVEQTLVGHTGSVLSVAFNHDGTKIVSGSGDQKLINCCLLQ